MGGWTNEMVKAIIELIISRFGGDLPRLVHCKKEIHNNIPHNKKKCCVNFSQTNINITKMSVVMIL